MPITPTNIAKSSTTISPVTKSGFFLLMEDGFYLLQENGDKIILDLDNYGMTATNVTKNSISPTNIAKN